MARGAGDGNRTHVTSLEGWSSAIELHPRSRTRMESGAVDETRTRDLNLGKVALYQLSYYRTLWCLGPESNQRHVDFQSTALPTELPRQDGDPEGARTLDLQRDRLAF